QWVILSAVAVGAVFLIRKLYLTVRSRQLSSLTYSRAFSDSGVFEGETVILTETVHNCSIFPLFRLDMESFIYEDLKIEGFDAPPSNSMQHCVSRFNLMPYMQITRTHVIRCRKRGYYTLESSRVFLKDEYRFYDAPAELYVYPHMVMIEDLPSPVNYLQGGVISKRQLIPDPFSVSGVREYMSGDPFNLVNFKQTARTGSLKVNNREFSSSRIFMIYVNFQTEQEDVYLTSAQYNKMIEQALSYSAALVGEALNSGYRVGFGANCVMTDGRMMLRYPVSSGTYSFEELLREMAMIRPRSGISFSALLAKDTAELLTQAEVFIFTPFVSETTDEEMHKLEKLGNSVSVISLTPEVTPA
ncbi:MAG TPA: DUF58 domain-containing protein, partial [Bacillota bacterium]|nr:DUF58 domain-containing protein [Bacillota bacterium]